MQYIKILSMTSVNTYTYSLKDQLASIRNFGTYHICEKSLFKQACGAIRWVQMSTNWSEPTPKS